MAKTGNIAKQRQREAIVAKYAERRARYKKDSVNMRLSEEERAEAMRRLHALPRDASPVRLRNRDAIDGRPRAFIRAFGLSRINLRNKAHAGELPGRQIQLVTGRFGRFAGEHTASERQQNTANDTYGKE